MLSTRRLQPRSDVRRLCVHTTHLFTRAQSECQFYAQCGYDNDKKVLLDFFQKIAGSSGQSPWSLHRNGAKSLIPKTSSARGSKMPAGILRRGRIARASPMDEVGSMPTSSIKNERAYHFWFTQSVELRGPARPAYAGVKSFAKAKR